MDYRDEFFILPYYETEARSSSFVIARPWNTGEAIPSSFVIASPTGRSNPESIIRLYLSDWIASFVKRTRNDVKGAMTLYLSLRLNAFAVLGGVGQAADAEGFSFCCAGFRCLFIVALNQTVVAIQVATAVA